MIRTPPIWIALLVAWAAFLLINFVFGSPSYNWSFWMALGLLLLASVEQTIKYVRK